MSVCVESRYAVQMNRYFLRYLGVWPLASDAHIFVRLWQKVSSFLVYFLLNFVLMNIMLHVVLVESDTLMKVKFVGPITFHLMVLANYSCLVTGIKEIEECYRHVEEDWKFYSCIELSIMQKKAEVGRFLALFCMAFMFGGATFYHAIMPLSAKHITSSVVLEQIAKLEMSNLTDSDIRNEIAVPRIFIYPVYEGLINMQASPRYECVLVLQLLSSSLLCTVTVGVCSLAAIYVVQVCGQLEIVMHLLDDYVKGSDATMKDIVDKHTRALRFAMRVETFLSPLCFVEFIGCSLDIVMLEYYFIVEWESRNAISTITYCTLLVSFTFNIFIFCYIGEILTDQCKRVGEITYEIEWYKLPGKKAVDLTLIMIISSCYPARITAGKMVYLSMESFSNVIKTSATYLNMLRTVML